MDDDIYEHLKKDFPEFDPAATIDEDEMKSKTGKERWRTFMMAYEKRIDDYNFGTLMRTNPKWEYGKDETIFGRRFWMHVFLDMTDAEYSSPDAILCHRNCQKQGRSERLDLREE